MNHGILADTARIGLLTGCVKIAGMLKTVMLARSFGTGDGVDAYLMAFLIPTFAGDVLAGAIAPSLMPALVQAKEQHGPRGARELSSRVLGAAIVFLTAVAAATAMIATPVLHVLAFGFVSQKLALTRTLLFWMLPILPLSGINATFRTILNVEGRFAATALTPIATPIAIIIAVWLLGTVWDSRALALGTVLGVLLETVLLSTVLRRLGLIVVPRLWGTSTPVRRVLSQYVPAASSYLVLGGSSLVDQMLAATLGAGSVSALSYGTRVTATLLSLGSNSLATAVMPRFSRLAALGQWTELIRMLRSLVLLSLGVTIPLTAMLAFFAEPLARLVFQHGAFSVGTTRFVANVQSLSLLQIPFAVVLMLLVRLVFALRATRLLFHLAVWSLAANIAFDLALMRWLGVAGIALSTSLVHLTGIVFLGLALLGIKPWSVDRPLAATPVSLVAGEP